MKLKCIIVDDEFLARKYLKDYVERTPFLELVGDFNSPLKAIDLIKNEKIDILFLDIQMPDINGLDFIKTIDNRPNVILTTAYEEYALEGFEMNVSDYLLKPFSFERYLKAVNKVMETAMLKNNLKNQSDNQVSKPVLHKDHLIIRADRRLYKINYQDLIYIEGQKAYVTFHTKKKKITALASLKELEEKLPSSIFLRIHKSFIVSINEIDSLEGNIIEIAGQKLSVGKMYKKDVDKIFGL